jgi:aspartyl-tRNA(Asn)/glutamyl-tRNA(Gln) amidotransferase subunit A
MATDVLSLNITELARRLKQRELSVVEIVEDCISRINEMNATLNAFVTVSADQARHAAKIADDEIRMGKYRGQLHGIPVGIKDMVNTSGIRTTYGSSIFRSNIPEKDAVAVSCLKEAGAIVLGKTNTHEFAFGVTTNNVHYGATRNPWAPDRIPGGSSGGSAAAVASFMCYGAVGTDTGGSIRIPSAFCGLVGFKPTYGLVSTTDVFPLAMSLDHVGPITRSVSDAAVMLQVMAGFDLDDPRSLNTPIPDLSQNIEDPIEKTKIAICPDLIPEIMDPDQRSAYESAMSKLENFGAEVLEKRIKSAQQIEKVSTTIMGAEAAVQHSELLKKHSDKYGHNVIGRFKAGQTITTADYIMALRGREVILREIELVFQDVDFLLTPSVQILPARIGEDNVEVCGKELSVVLGCVCFTRLANVTGIPAITLPYGYSDEGLPLSIQLMAPKWREKHLLNLAYNIEKATPELRNRKPKFCPRNQ